MNLKLLLVGAAAMAALPGFATDLWNQEAFFHANGGNGQVDQVFTDFAGYPTYQVGDVIVGSGGWNVTTIQTEIIAGTPTDPITAINQATLNIFLNAGGGLPTLAQDPSTGTNVSVVVTQDTNFAGGNVFFVTATVNLNLTAGEYWIGLTPVAAFGTYGQLYTGETTDNSAGSNYTAAIRNPGGGFGAPTGTGWGDFLTWNGSPDGYDAMDIQGLSTPEPCSMAILGIGAVGLIARRRRKA